MKTIHNLLMFIQWALFITGILGAPALGYFYGWPEALLALVVGLQALTALKIEVVAFTR